MIWQDLETKQVRPQRFLLLVLVGAARGMSSVLRSLQNMSFVAEHSPTECFALNRFFVVPGEQLDNDTLGQVLQNSETLLAAMTRVGARGCSLLQQFERSLDNGRPEAR